MLVVAVVPPEMVYRFSQCGLTTAIRRPLHLSSYTETRLTEASVSGSVGRGVHAVYVGSARALGVGDAGRQVKGLEGSVVALTHPRWLSRVRARRLTNCLSQNTPPTWQDD